MSKSRGRPSSYSPEFAHQARLLCERYGATDADLAEFFSVSRRTIQTWKIKHAEFLRSLSLGKEAADDRVERALYERCLGYSHEEEKIFCYEGKIVRVNTIKRFPPDTKACLGWLYNRRGDKWRRFPEGQMVDAEQLAQAISDLNEKQHLLI